MILRKNSYNRFRGQGQKSILDIIPGGFFSTDGRRNNTWLPRVTPEVIGQNEHTQRPAIFRRDL